LLEGGRRNEVWRWACSPARESHFDSKDENVTLAIDDRHVRPPRSAGRPATLPADAKVPRAMLFIGTATYIQRLDESARNRSSWVM